MTLLLFMAGNGRRLGYRHLLDAFWDDAAVAGVPLPMEEPVSAPAFCQARAKLSSEFVRSLSHRLANRFESTFAQDSYWRGRRYCPQIKVSMLFNVVSKAPVDVAVGRCRNSERAQLTEDHLSLTKPGDVLVLDRGLDAEVDVVARVSTKSTFPAVQEFLESGGQDRRIVIQPTCSVPASELPLHLRAVRSKRPSGDDIVLLTTLDKKAGFTRADIEELYRMRWEVEEHYKVLKSDYMGRGQLHSRSAAGVKQEIASIALFHSLSRFFLAAAAEHVDGSLREAVHKVSMHRSRRQSHSVASCRRT